MGAAVALLGLAMLGEVNAQTLCSMPVQPLCSTDISAVTTKADRHRCLEDIDRFRSNLAEYRACLDGVLAKAQALEEASDRFRRCLREESGDCVMKPDR